MGRNGRGDEPGSWHHVMNRGIARRTVFETREDVRYFLSRIAHAVRRQEVEIHAFCVMTTHFHLLARSPEGCLSEAMRRIQNEYVRRFNRTRRRDGALFRGRFRSRPVDSLVYREVLVRYIDANPVSAGLVRSAHIYPHGSARAYALKDGPPWLERSWVEEVVREVSGSRVYDPGTYAAVFGADLPTSLTDLVERRIAGGFREPDPLDNLVSERPTALLDWMRRKARLADGTRPGLPVCDPESVTAAVERDRAVRGCWFIQPGKKQLDAWPHVHVALLCDLAGLAAPEAAHRVGCSESGVGRMRERHRTLLGDDGYAERVRAIAAEALRTCGVSGM
jgi:REP element-mobilizing transposase RayT